MSARPARLRLPTATATHTHTHPRAAQEPLSTLWASEVQMLRHFQRTGCAGDGGGTRRSRRVLRSRKAPTEAPSSSTKSIAGLPEPRARRPRHSPSPGAERSKPEGSGEPRARRAGRERGNRGAGGAAGCDGGQTVPRRRPPLAPAAPSPWRRPPPDPTRPATGRPRPGASSAAPPEELRQPPNPRRTTAASWTSAAVAKARPGLGERTAARQPSGRLRGGQCRTCGLGGRAAFGARRAGAGDGTGRDGPEPRGPPLFKRNFRTSRRRGAFGAAGNPPG